MPRGAPPVCTFEREETCLCLKHGREFDNRETTGLRDGTRWRVHRCLDNQCLDLQMSQIEVKYVSIIGWIEGCTGGAGSYSEKCDSHLWAIWQHQSNPIVAAEPHSMQRLHSIVYMSI